MMTEFIIYIKTFVFSGLPVKASKGDPLLLLLLVGESHLQLLPEGLLLPLDGGLTSPAVDEPLG